MRRRHQPSDPEDGAAEIAVRQLQCQGVMLVSVRGVHRERGFRLTIHHVGVLVDDFDAVTVTMTRHGLRAAWRADLPNGMRVSYTRLPLLGHMVELVHYGGDSGAFLAGVRAQVALDEPVRR